MFQRASPAFTRHSCQTLDFAKLMSSISKQDKAIIRMLHGLQDEMGVGMFDIVGHWGGDQCAIGVSLPSDHGVLVYISSNPGNKDDYWVSLESPPIPVNELPYVPAGEREVHGIQELASVIRAHFGAPHA